jgi:hypothetical protein
MRLGYKVCSRHKKKLMSCMRFCSYAIEYVPDKVTKPKKDCGPLAVFDTLEDAASFLPFNSDEIWKCEYEPSRGKSLFHKNYCKRRICTCPEGTRLARSVKLIERVA